ncbi:MAG: antibiotic biosynthesis monooxygenase [Phenylobacterium sp.]|nr:antibiotic biosynthesis monooxygenase [Phenylobacterium sp.]
MSVVVAGHFRLPPENLAGLKPHMAVVVSATRAEDGCLVYAYAEDVLEPGLIRVFEVWRDQAALDGHFASAHMKAWQQVRAGFGLYDRDIKAYEVAGERQL